jgi:uncharacterized small protein (DUF1192 family)
MDRWDLLMIATAAYVAVVALVRLMTARRDEVVRVIREEIERQQAEQANLEADRDAA